MYFQRSLYHLYHLCHLYRLYRLLPLASKGERTTGDHKGPLRLSSPPSPLQEENRSLDYALRQAREPGKIGLALLEEGIPPLLALFGHVVEHCRIAGQLLNTRQAIGVCIESRFQEA